MSHSSNNMPTKALVHAKDVLAQLSLMSDAELIEFGEEMTYYSRGGTDEETLAGLLFVRMAEIFKDGK